MNYARGLWIGIGVAAALMGMTGVAAAIPLTLSGPAAGNTIGPQSESAPCIIAGTTCGQQPAGFGYNLFDPNNDESYDRYSTNAGAVNVAEGVEGTAYTAGQITGIVGSQFLIAIDVNSAGGNKGHLETLQLFEVKIGGVVVYDYLGPTLIGDFNNNGNGFGDWTLGTVDLTGYAANTTVLFHAVWDGASDGSESFFLVSAVPGPLAGAGLPGLIAACGGLIALARRRRKLIAA